jgi:hypothetical protein
VTWVKGLIKGGSGSRGWMCTRGAVGGAESLIECRKGGKGKEVGRGVRCGYISISGEVVRTM